MDITFKILAVILAGIAAYFLWQGNTEVAFVTTVFGAVSFFLSVRFQVKERLKLREAGREEAQMRAEEEEIEEFEDESPQLNEMTANEQIDHEKSLRATDKEQI